MFGASVAADARAVANRGLIDTLQIEVSGNTRAVADNARIAGANAAAIRGFDFGSYRTSSDQDIIDARATAGILLARQEAATADGKAVAAQGTAGIALDRAGANAARVETVNTARINGDISVREELRQSIRALIVDPDYWLLDNNAHRILVTINPAVIPAGTAFVRLRIAGTAVTTHAKDNTVDTYSVPVTAIDSGTITRNSGASKSVAVSVEFLDSSRNSISLLNTHIRALANPPGGGTGTASVGITHHIATLASTIVGLLPGGNRPIAGLSIAAGTLAVGAAYMLMARLVTGGDITRITFRATSGTESLFLAWDSGNQAYLYGTFTVPARSNGALAVSLNAVLSSGLSYNLFDGSNITLIRLT